MTLFEFLAIVAVIAGLAWGVQAALGGGVWAVILGGLLGAGKGFLIWMLFMVSILIPLSLGLWYRPMFPRCRKGRCTSRDFRYLYLEQPAPPQDREIQDREIEVKYDGNLVQCACGDRYIRSDRERRFYEIREDGSAVPFMRYRFAGRWRGVEADAESGYRARETP